MRTSTGELENDVQSKDAEILKKDVCIQEFEEELRRLKESLQVALMPRS